MWTKSFWQASAERAVRTLCQTLLALLGAAGISDATLHFTWSWGRFWIMVGTAGLAALLSLLTSIVAGAKTGNASFVPASELTTPPGAVVDVNVNEPGPLLRGPSDG